MALASCTDSEFVETFKQFGATGTARKLGINVRTVQRRAARLSVITNNLTISSIANNPRLVQQREERLGVHLNGTFTEREQAAKLNRPRTHCLIPDVQAKPGVPLDHLKWAGEYIAEKKPDVIIQIGDFSDLPSLSSWDKGKRAAENQRYKFDLDATHKAMELLMTPIVKERESHPEWNPRLVLTLGNHEDRITRYADNNAELHGTISVDDLGYKAWGWEVYPFLEVVEIDNIEYAHYFTSGVMCRACSSAAAMLRERQQSCSQGHVQYYEEAIHKKTQQRALMAGCFYQHDETYLGAQGNSYRRHIIFKHEVTDGRYDKMEVSLDFLRRRYG